MNWSAFITSVHEGSGTLHVAVIIVIHTCLEGADRFRNVGPILNWKSEPIVPNSNIP